MKIQISWAKKNTRKKCVGAGRKLMPLGSLQGNGVKFSPDGFTGVSTHSRTFLGDTQIKVFCRISRNKSR